MRQLMVRFAAAVSAVALALGPCGSAQAGFGTQVGAEGQQFSFPDYGTWYQGATSSDHGWSYGDAENGASGSAAVSLLSGGSGIHLNSQSRGTGGLLVAGEWLDVIRFVGNSGDAPPVLRIGVHVNGSIQARGGLQSYDRVGLVNFPSAELLLGPARDSAALPGLVSEVYLSVSDYHPTRFDPPYNASNFAYDGVSGGLNWDVQYDLSYQEAVGGYMFNLYASAASSAYGGGSATADFGHTITLNSVTLPDGSPLPGNIAFDSGFTLGSPEAAVATPAPSSLLVMAVGAGIGAWRLRRTQRREAARGSTAEPHNATTSS